MKSDYAEGIRFGNETIKLVDEFRYLGSNITYDGRSVQMI